ncbi:hypothetical protein [Hydrogenophaga sp.]|uniref:hypothetical protein n=1 Tax=Hydrogenophaga sp. TaxID=1904254 RepID=UPI00344F2378|nr:hypothetical protein [Hydrogenophaga sp.]
MASQNSKSNPKKPKLVRDSFTIPKNEFAAIEALKTRAIALGTSVKKSELLRAGLVVLQGLNDAGFKAALAAVPTLKTGRPKVEEAAPVKTPAKAAQKPATAKAVVKTTAARKAPAKRAPAVKKTAARKKAA